MNTDKEQAKIAETIERAAACGMQFINLDNEPLIPELTLELLSIEVARRHRVIPINWDGSTVTIATDDETDTENMDTIRGLLPNYEVTFYLATNSAMDRALDKRYSAKLYESRA